MPCFQATGLQKQCNIDLFLVPGSGRAWRSQGEALKFSVDKSTSFVHFCVHHAETRALVLFSFKLGGFLKTFAFLW